MQSRFQLPFQFLPLFFSFFISFHRFLSLVFSMNCCESLESPPVIMGPFFFSYIWINSVKDHLYVFRVEWFGCLRTIAASWVSNKALNINISFSNPCQIWILSLRMNSILVSYHVLFCFKIFCEDILSDVGLGSYFCELNVF